MGRKRLRHLLIGALALIMVTPLVYRFWPGTSGGAARTSNGQGPAAAGRAAGSAVQTAPDVHLDALNDERPKPGDVDRNLFRFKPKPAPPPPVSAAPPVVAPPSGPPPPPPLPPIPLRFIGTASQGDGPKYAVLSDSAGHIDSGKEGDVIQGRYRILRIGAESIEMSYLDGRGRQTIRQGG